MSLFGFPKARLTLALIALMTLSLAGCGSSSDESDATTTSSTAPASTTTPDDPSREPVFCKYERITPVDEPKLLEGVKKREPERASQFTDAELVALGNRDCELIIAAQTVEDRQQAEVTLQSEIAASGKSRDVARYISSDIRNASVDTLCRRIPN